MTGPVDDPVDAEADRIFAARDRDHMDPTIAAFEVLLAEHPGHPRALYEVGGAHDTAGNEEVAAGYYERALAAGLPPEVERRCLLQYGSTLRNLGRHDESLAVLDRGTAAFPDSSSLRVFRALSLHAGGRPDAALAEALRAVVVLAPGTDAERYVPAIEGNAGYLDELDRDR